MEAPRPPVEGTIPIQETPETFPSPQTFPKPNTHDDTRGIIFAEATREERLKPLRMIFLPQQTAITEMDPYKKLLARYNPATPKRMEHDPSGPKPISLRDKQQESAA